MINEEAACQQYLLDYLATDPTLMSLLEGGIWLRSVPDNEPLPAVKIDRQSSSDLNVVNLYRVWTDMLYLVRGIVHWRGTGAVDWSEAQAIGDRLDVLLHKYEGQNATIAIHSFREESFTDETLESGDLFLHCGGMYRVRAHAL